MINCYKSVDNKKICEVFDFAEALLAHPDKNNNSQGSEVERDEQDSLVDKVQGKLAEWGVSDFFRDEFGIILQPDMTVFRGFDQGNDYPTFFRDYSPGRMIEEPTPIMIDTKSTKDNNKWLLVLSDRLDNPQFKADYYILATYSDRPPTRNTRSCTITVHGWAKKQDFFDIKGRVRHLFPKNTQLPSYGDFRVWSESQDSYTSQEFDQWRLGASSTPMRGLLSDNSGIPISQLRKSEGDWTDLAQLVYPSCQRKL